MSNIDRILGGDKETLINEIHDAVKWAREMSAQDWYNITHDADGGLLGVIRRIVDGQVNKGRAEEKKAKRRRSAFKVLH